MAARDRQFCEVAVREAQKSAAEDGRVHPKVGVVVATEGAGALAAAYRGEFAPGEHAEYTALERKLSSESVAGATVYTTLEPCTTRNHPKTPCAERLIDRKVSRVVIGMLDPNPAISGKGVQALRRTNIAVDFFPPDLMSIIEEMNREFTKTYVDKPLDKAERGAKADPERFVNSSLDEWYRLTNRIYWGHNFHRDLASIFMHLVEVIGGLSGLASQKVKAGPSAEIFIPKAFAWWFALCSKANIKSVEDMLWTKFPNVCPYCLSRPHDPDECQEKKASRPGPNWEELERIGVTSISQRPPTLGGWQSMFSRIYPAQQTEDYGPTFGRLTEELGELAETLRVFGVEPGYFVSEAADVFAWLMHLQNLIDQKKGTPKVDRGSRLNRAFAQAYPGVCLDCAAEACVCPPVLTKTIGRIAHEVPRNRLPILFGAR